jgi:hypothetical protein
MLYQSFTFSQIDKNILNNIVDVLLNFTKHKEEETILLFLQDVLCLLRSKRYVKEADIDECFRSYIVSAFERIEGFVYLNDYTQVVLQLQTIKAANNIIFSY